MAGEGVEGRTIFLTGGTGEIGGELLHRFLEDGARRIYCLVRASSGREATERLLRRLHKRLEIRLDSRVVPVRGDLAMAALGIDRSVASELKREVDLIFHCAATTSFLKNRECWQTNVAGLRHLIDLARGCVHSPRFFYFGSASAAGDRKDACIGEAEYPRANAKHFVQYAASKAAAERILQEEAADLDVVVLRPSMVIPDTYVPDEILTECIWPLQIMKECSALPLNGEAAVDLVPLSYVGTATLSIASDCAHRCYHLSAGSAGATKWSNVMDLVAETFALARPIACLQGEAWRSVRPSLARREVALMRTVSAYFPFINQNVTYDNARLLGEFGPPAAGTFHLDRYLPQLLRRVSLDAAIGQSRYD